MIPRHEQTTTETTSSMPLWIAVACCAAAVMMVFGNTIPAMHDQDELSQVESDLGALKRKYDEAIRVARRSGARGGPTADLDLQSLFVAIDQKGYTVAEFCAAHAAEEPSEPPAEGPTRGR